MASHKTLRAQCAFRPVNRQDIPHHYFEDKMIKDQEDIFYNFTSVGWEKEGYIKKTYMVVHNANWTELTGIVQ